MIAYDINHAAVYAPGSTFNVAPFYLFHLTDIPNVNPALIANFYNIMNGCIVVFIKG